MRDILPLRTLALRAVGPPSCNPEVTFGGPKCRRLSSIKSDTTAGSELTSVDGKRKRKDDLDNIDVTGDEDFDRNGVGDDNDGLSASRFSFVLPAEKPTITSRLLRSLRRRPTSGGESNKGGDASFESEVESVPLPCEPYTGAGRPNANDVDLSHPWILAIHPKRSRGSSSQDSKNAVISEDEFLTIENGNHAVECLQLFIDALVESGRAGDSRLGVHFFREWVIAVAGVEAIQAINALNSKGKNRSSKKRRRSEDGDESRPRDLRAVMSSLPLGSLSLHNLSSASVNTFRSMEKSNVGICLGTLDLTGVHGCTDFILSKIICAGSFPRLRRLSIKNCRKVTGKGLASLEKLSSLRALDIGGCFNIKCEDVVALVQNHPGTQSGKFNEIYASGLGWTDVALEQLVDASATHLRGLGIGFSPYVSGPGLILTLSKVANTLERLAVPFCEGMDDAAAAALGRELTKLSVLDIRGCNKLSSLTGMLDGRVASGVIRIVESGPDRETTEGNGQDAVVGHLFVLARYSGVTKNSLDETLRVHHHDQGDILTCILDGGGIGEGIRR